MVHIQIIGVGAQMLADYDQHIKFAQHRNDAWQGGTAEEFMKFALEYADNLEKE